MKKELIIKLLSLLPITLFICFMMLVAVTILSVSQTIENSELRAELQLNPIREAMCNPSVFNELKNIYKDNNCKNSIYFTHYQENENFTMWCYTEDCLSNGYCKQYYKTIMS